MTKTPLKNCEDARHPVTLKPPSLAAWVVLLVFAPLSFALESNEWKHRQTLLIERAGLTKIALPPATLDLARAHLEDLRLLDSSGAEVPYVLEHAAPSTPPTLRAPRSFRTTLTDTSTQVRLETGNDTPLDAVTLHTPAPSFLKAARVEVSEDGERWETLQQGAPLFRQFGAEQLRVDLGHRGAAHVRITLDDARTRPVPFTGATLSFAATVQPPITAALPLRVASREEFAGETLLTLDLGARHVPLAELEFISAEPLFARKITVAVRELQDDTTTERTLATGSIYRVAADGLVPSAELTVPVNFTASSRELLVHIYNQDSPPLALEDVRAQQRPIWLVFRAAAPGPYTLLTGNPDAAPPRYDLAALAVSLREAAPSSLSPTAPELNPAYRRANALANTPFLGGAIDPAPWRFRKAVRVITPGVQQLELDLDVLARAQPNFADLRLVRERTQVPYLLERSLLSRVVPLVIENDSDPKSPSVSRWKLILPRHGFPATRLTLTANTALFQRQVRVFERLTDARGQGYDRTLGEATWSKSPNQVAPLVLPLNAAPESDALILETDNGDNPPLVLGPVQAHYSVARLLFKVEETPSAVDDSAPLVLYYGNPQSVAPRYDVRLVAPQILSAEKNPATLEVEEKARPDGWATSALAKARGGPLFWGALALVVIVLLVVVAKLLPKQAAATKQGR